MSRLRRTASGQAGYTLIEVIVATAIGALLMAGLSSVIFTSLKAITTATTRVEASSEIRNLQRLASNDFALSTLSDIPGSTSCTMTSPCTTPIILSGFPVSNGAMPAPSQNQATYTYTWDGVAFLDRWVGSPGSNCLQSPSCRHVGTNVTAFSWYIDGSYPNQTVVVSVTVTYPLPNQSGPGSAFLGDPYSESQTLRFYPEVNP